jgi:hypothetical protein
MKDNGSDKEDTSIVNGGVGAVMSSGTTQNININISSGRFTQCTCLLNQTGCSADLVADDVRLPWLPDQF